MKGNQTWKKIKKLSKKELNKLLDIMGVGISQSLDKGELQMLIGMEPEYKIKAALKRLK